MKFSLREPCDDCPFLRKRKFLLTRERVTEILYSVTVEDKTFACHKTTREDDDGEYIYSKKEQHCAGVLILLEKMQKPNQLMRIAERMGWYDHTKLKMDSDVYTTPEAMLKARHWL